jgi:outer membrane murein-binding lipoprotein Lpp
MAEIRETEVERDAEGRVVGYRERVSENVDTKPARRGGGGKFALGLLLGAVLLAVAIIAFAYSQGGFQQAGVEADQMAAQIEQRTDQAVDATDSAVQGAADTTQRTVVDVNRETSDTVTN